MKLNASFQYRRAKMRLNQYIVKKVKAWGIDQVFAKVDFLEALLKQLNFSCG